MVEISHEHDDECRIPLVKCLQEVIRRERACSSQESAGGKRTSLSGNALTASPTRHILKLTPRASSPSLSVRRQVSLSAASSVCADVRNHVFNQTWRWQR